MPIEIKELHIHVVVNSSPDGQASNRQQDFTGGIRDRNNVDAGKEALVAECVEQVLEILQNKRER